MMAHSIRAVVAARDAIHDLASAFCDKPLDLDQGISLLRVSENFLNNINDLVGLAGPDTYSEFRGLSRSLESILLAQSFRWTIGYIETDYWGGTGAQSAIGWAGEEVVFGPELSRTEWDSLNQNMVVSNGWPIDGLLRMLGVWTDGKRDEFDMLGIGNYR